MDFGGWDCSLRGKGNFLYSTTIAKSTIDSSTKTMEDGVVDSPPNRNAQLVTVSSPSPLRAKSTNPAYMLGHLEIQGLLANSINSFFHALWSNEGIFLDFMDV